MVRIGCVVLALLIGATSAGAETKEQWIELGARIHGAFGVLIPIGIRIGLDAVARLKPEPRGLTVTFYSGERAPCPCIVDGVMLATGASPGQGTLHVAPETAPAGQLAVVVIRNRKTGEGVRYAIAGSWGPKIIEWNSSLDPSARYDAVMNAEGLFTAEAVGP